MSKKIPGIPIRVFSLGDALLKCQFTMTYSDALDLCKKTTVGLPANRELRDRIMDNICEEMESVIQERQKNLSNGQSTNQSDS